MGRKPMTGIAQFSEALLQNVRAKDAGAVGEQLTDLLMKVKSVDLSKFGDKRVSWKVFRYWVKFLAKQNVLFWNIKHWQSKSQLFQKT